MPLCERGQVGRVSQKVTLVQSRWVNPEKGEGIEMLVWGEIVKTPLPTALRLQPE